MPNRETIKIPDRWLQGCSMMREKEGMGPMEAVHECIRRWREQERLGAKHDKQQKEHADND